ncbi:MAG: hypothetical protein AAFQ52_02505 [Chloroflexota bacterium]
MLNRWLSNKGKKKKRGTLKHTPKPREPFEFTITCNQDMHAGTARLMVYALAKETPALKAGQPVTFIYDRETNKLSIKNDGGT